MKRYFIITAICLSLNSLSSYAQVGMTTNNPNKDSALDLNITNGTNTKGLLLPKVALTAINIASPMLTHVAGMRVYNTATDGSGVNAVTPGQYYNDGSKWVRCADDNLGNHIATQTLNMANNNITGATNISTQTAKIAKGTDNGTPATGNIATAADDSGNIVWKPANTLPGAISNVIEYFGSGKVSVPANTQKSVLAAKSFNVPRLSTLVITSSALGAPSAVGAPVQGSIDLYFDGVKVISTYYSGADAPNNLLWGLSNFSTSKKVIQNVATGTHTIELKAKSWYNTTMFNTDPYADKWAGALSTDTQALASRLTVVVYNQ
ncbi:hypothetical protein ACQ9BO_07205 [Flavobacterium sp. P21]|uniref:hypothetical protein n=1 Tax=Flavobacterium sp. P21 TaxID=3423948 RepID=UPI003D66971F